MGDGGGEVGRVSGGLRLPLVMTVGDVTRHGQKVSLKVKSTEILNSVR